MKKNKLLFILLPVVIVVVLLLGAYAYLTFSSSPKKVFQTAINSTFKELEKAQQEQYDSAKSSFVISGNIESDEEEAEEINNILSDSKIELEAGMDMKNLVFDYNFDVTYDNEKLLDTELILQKEKLYILLQDWFSKYIEIPIDDLEMKEYIGTLEDVNSFDRISCLEAVKEELNNEIAKQEFKKETVTLQLDGKNVRLQKNYFRLNESQLQEFVKNFLTNLKNNSQFQTSLGNNKQDVLDEFETYIELLEEETYTEDNAVEIAIYTSGLMNKFAGINLKIFDGDKEQGTVSFVKSNNGNSEFAIYDTTSNGEREDIVKVRSEKLNNNSGKITIDFFQDGNKQEVLVNFQKEGNTISFEASTEVEEVKFKATGDLTKSGTKYFGKCVLSVVEESIGTINLNIVYDYELNAEINKKDVSNSVSVENMTQEEQEELVTNLQNSSLYKMFLENYVESYFGAIDQAAEQSENVLNLMNEEMDQYYSTVGVRQSIFKYGNIVYYKIPMGLELTDTTDEYYQYEDGKNDMVKVTIKEIGAEEYLNNLSSSEILTSRNYTNQSISDISDYEVNGKIFKYRGIKYSNIIDDYSLITFAYDLGNGYAYCVEATIKENGLSLDDVNFFLEIEKY